MHGKHLAGSPIGPSEHNAELIPLERRATMKRYLLGVLCMMPSLLFSQKPNPLKKAYFHQGAHQGIHTKAHQHIELGNVVFYFEQTPRIESSVVQKKGETLHMLFLPHVSVSQDLVQVLEEIHNQTDNHPFTVQFAVKDSQARKGLEITMVYPTNTVGVKYDHFNSIGLQKGVRLQLFNKALINQINQLGKHIITTASLAPRVFIDCGHGGTDCGAVCNDVKEKDVSLEVGLTLADALKNNGLLVTLSRDHDEFVSLDARTTLANNSHADLFVSIHANGAANSAANGIETFFLNADLLQEGECFLLSLFERKHTRDQQTLKCAKSNRLAVSVHDALLKTVCSEHVIVDRRVKAAVSQVLLGTQMPSVLVEVGFVTHPREAQLLSEKSYQEKVARGIATGIMQYLGRA